MGSVLSASKAVAVWSVAARQESIDKSMTSRCCYEKLGHPLCPAHLRLSMSFFYSFHKIF